MLFTFGPYTLDIDVERTRAFYDRSDVKITSEQCTCAGCQNYDKAILQAPAAVLDFFQSLGIDPRKPAEVFSVMGGELDENDNVWYNGWYHVCGTMVEGPETVVRTVGENNVNYISKFLWERAYRPDPDFPFSMLPVKAKELLHKDFPTPVLQIEIDAHLPWVLSEKKDD